MFDAVMSFGLGEEIEALRDMVRRFAADEIAPRAAQIDADNEFPADLWQKLGALGLLGITVSRRTAARAWAISPIASRWRRSAAPRRRSACRTARIPISASTRSAAGARDEQKRKYLPKLISGEHVGALAMSEPGAGSDVVGDAAARRASRTTATCSTATRCGSPTGRTPTRWSSTPRPIPRPGRAASPPSSSRAAFDGLLDRAEARQARHARLQHLRAGVRGLRGAGRERARRAGQGRQRADVAASTTSASCWPAGRSGSWRPAWTSWCPTSTSASSSASRSASSS